MASVSARKTDRIDAWVLAELSRRDLVPAIWLLRFAQRAERAGPRRLFSVRKRSALRHRVHAQLVAVGHACPVGDLFGRRAVSCLPPGVPGSGSVGGARRRLLARDRVDAFLNRRNTSVPTMTSAPHSRERRRRVRRRGQAGRI